jgi:hypothetical protein
MNPSLKRIEATLQQLDQGREQPKSLPTSAETPPSGISGEEEELQALLAALPGDWLKELHLHTAATEADWSDELTVSATSSRVLELPDVCRSPAVDQRLVNDPGLALGLLKEMSSRVEGWQQTLQQALHQIQTIYQAGPIVNGWLESKAVAGQPEGTTEYRLCGVNNQGSQWFRPCPADQVAEVSLAIARYQKLQQLLATKQLLEQRLSHINAALIKLHESLQD